MTKPALIWFRNDLRLNDHLALAAAAELGAPVLPVFVWSPDEEGSWPPGAASRWWLHQSLAALEKQLTRAGSRLVYRRGPAVNTLLALAKETGAQAVFWHRRYEPAVREQEARIERALREAGLEARSFPGALLHEPGELKNKASRAYQVFTPFWKACLGQPAPPKPLPAPRKLHGPSKWPYGLPLEALELEPRVDWTTGLRAAWQPGEAGAQRQWKRFCRQALLDYTEKRDRPDLPGTSRLSPHLHFGEITPRQIWHGVRECAEAKGLSARTWRHFQFLTELGWREFAHHLLYHFPHTPTHPLRTEFARFPWRDEPDWLHAWQRGATGYPFIDAGMRELWATGWMHNRVRMAVASFLVKDLRLPWVEGARWFWDTLVDADLADNTLGWQWTTGCGADAAPYFRVFNPAGQGRAHDPEGRYTRQWVPELARLPDRWIHEPWRAPRAVLAEAGVELGRTYPEPIVNHAIARATALEAYGGIKRARS